MFQFLHRLINTPGPGRIMVSSVGIGSVTAYVFALKWIADGVNCLSCQNINTKFILSILYLVVVILFAFHVEALGF